MLGYVPWERDNAYRRRFALVMGQKNQLWWDLPAAESFRLHQQIYRIEPAAVSSGRTTSWSTCSDVRQLLNQPVRELSLGERMKMELIAALLHSPEVLFLDEPTIGLDVDRPAQHPEVPEALPGSPPDHDPAHQPLHEGRGRPLPPRGRSSPTGRSCTTARSTGIIDRFSGHKVLTLQFADEQMPSDLARYGEVLEVAAAAR